MRREDTKVRRDSEKSLVLTYSGSKLGFWGFFGWKFLTIRKKRSKWYKKTPLPISKPSHPAPLRIRSSRALDSKKRERDGGGGGKGANQKFTTFLKKGEKETQRDRVWYQHWLPQRMNYIKKSSLQAWQANYSLPPLPIFQQLSYLLLEAIWSHGCWF